MRIPQLLFLFLFSFAITSICAQVKVAKIDVNEVFDLTNMHELHQSVNKETGEFCLFMLNNGMWTAALFDKESNFKKRLNLKRSSFTGFKEITHTYFDGDRYNLIFEDLEYIYRLSFNFNENMVFEETIQLPKIISSVYAHFQINNAYYFIGLERYSSDIHFLKLTNKEGFELSKSTLEKDQFRIYDESLMEDLLKPIDLFSFLEYHSIERFETIYQNEEISINQSGSPAKLYAYKDKVRLCLDLSRNLTSIINISLSNFDSEINWFPYNATMDHKRKAETFNSFILNEELYQLKAIRKVQFLIPSFDLKGDTPAKLKLQITDLNSGQVVRQFDASNEDEKIEWIYGPFTSFNSNNKTKYKKYITKDEGYVMIAHLALNDPLIFPKFDKKTKKLKLFFGFTKYSPKFFDLKETNANPLIRSLYHTNSGRHYVSEIKLNKEDTRTVFNDNIFHQIDDYVKILENDNYSIDPREVITIFYTDQIAHLAYYNQKDNTLRIVQF